MGIVHVLTGPDHLSAIATLSVNVGNFRAFWYGIRWGVGHSIGLIVVGSFFITLENMHYNKEETRSGSDNDSDRVIEIPERLEHLAASFVGLFMLSLGLYNIYGAWSRRQRKEEARTPGHCHHKHCHHVHHYDDKNDGKYGLGTLSCDSLTKTTEIRNYGDGKSFVDLDNDDCESPFVNNNNDPLIDSMGIDDNKDKNDDLRNKNDSMDGKKFLSLWIGIFHGVAGPGGVLGVVPAVRLHNPWHSVVYLGSFCTSSIATMGIFAALYGSLSATWTRHNDKLAYGVELFSAFLSVLVGCAWLVLLYLGLLDVFFP